MLAVQCSACQKGARQIVGRPARHKEIAPGLQLHSGLERSLELFQIRSYPCKCNQADGMKGCEAGEDPERIVVVAQIQEACLHVSGV